MTDNNGYVLAPLPVAPVNETDMVLLPKGLNALKQVAKEVGLDLRGAYVNLDGGFDSRANRKCIFNAGMIPNIKENPRNRKRTKRGRKRLFNAAIHALRMRVERTFAWEDKFIVQEFAFFAPVLADGWGESQKETMSGRGPNGGMALAAWTWYNKALQHPNTPDRCGPMYAEVTPGWNVFKQIFTEHWEGFKPFRPRYNRHYRE